MTELKPVALLNKFDKGYTTVTQHTVTDEGLVSSIPLYTAEQLHPRVKMTKDEFEEFELLYKSINSSTIIGLLTSIRQSQGNNHKNLKARLNKSGKDIEIVNLWADFNPENPEETIEIVPNMKWFVRSKISDEKYGYWYLHKTERFFFHEYIKENSTQFDTKEEAEEWTNPLTEVVQLPVEE